MAIRLEDEYANAEAASSDYPQSSFKNATSTSATDGTPLEKRWANDIIGFLQRLLLLAGITPSGAPDTALVSDYYNALERLFARFLIYNDTGTANAYILNSALGDSAESFFDGLTITFKAVNANTGPSTIKVGGLSVVDVVNENGAALAAGVIAAGEYSTVIYRTTSASFELISFGRKAVLSAHIANTQPHGATSEATANTLSYRDENGKTDVQPGTSGNNVVNFSQFAGLKAVDGYLTLPNGWVIQWGTVSGSEDSWGTRSYPYTFPNDALIIVGSGSQGVFGTDTDIQLQRYTASQFKVVNNSYGSATVSYIAIGY